MRNVHILLCLVKMVSLVQIYPTLFPTLFEGEETLMAHS